MTDEGVQEISFSPPVLLEASCSASMVSRIGITQSSKRQ